MQFEALSHECGAHPGLEIILWPPCLAKRCVASKHEGTLTPESAP